MVYRQTYRFMMPMVLFAFVACAPGPAVNIQNAPFPPSPVLPLNIVITQPLVPYSHEAGHECLKDWNQSPGQRRVMMHCVWQDGLQNMTRMMIPGTIISSLNESRNPLSAVGPGILAETDSMGVVQFALSNPSVLDVAGHHRWTHLVVAHDIQYSVDEEGELVLSTPAAIVDVLERRIVWQGIIDSRQISAKQLGTDDSLKPGLTNFEEVTYRFILDLAQILERRLSPCPKSRHELAQPCQAPPPLLNLSGD